LTFPAVSILLPFKNADRYLEEALESIEVQTFEDFEVVMVNDHSDDDSVIVAEDRCSKDPRFILADSKGSGIVDALNTGLDICSGTWIARMDADDISMPRRIEKQYGLASEMGPGTVVSCQVRSFPDEIISDGYRLYENWLNDLTDHEEIEKSLFIESPVPHPTAFFHRRKIQSEGGYMERALPEDYELWLRLWSRGYKFARVPEVLLNWRERPDRLSRTSRAYSLTSFYTLKARYLEYVPCMAGKVVFVAGSGQTARRLGKCLQENGFHIEAFIDPSLKRQGKLLRGRPVTSPEVLSGRSGIPVVIASRLPGARKSIVEFLDMIGFKEWEDYVACS
jgi:glycosyltransferase involved in cell wall biosynthesis